MHLGVRFGAGLYRGAKTGLLDPDNLKGTTVADYQPATGNAAQIEFWNSPATRAWADQYARMDRAVAALTKELLDLAAPQPGERVLDIGCGPAGQFLSWRGASIRAVMCSAQMSPSNRSPERVDGSLLPAPAAHLHFTLRRNPSLLTAQQDQVPSVTFRPSA